MFFVMACNNNKDIDSLIAKKSMSSNFDSSIDSLSDRYIFFGHKSVGYNIVDGIKKLIETDDLYRDLVLYEMSDEINLSGPGFYHAPNGQNNFPKTKCDAFKEFLLDKRQGDNFDIAFFKLCYVDIQKNTDVQDIFDYYVKTIEEIRSSLPRLKIIHVTVPLCSYTWGIKGTIKRILVPDVSNVKRNQYNQLLIDRYADNEPLYDLAKIESTRPDGSRSSFKYKGQVYYSLYNGYTDDGGHLNELGRLVAAKELLEVLAEVAEVQ